MTDQTTRFQQLLEEIDRTPWGPAEQALTAEAVALAQELGDEQLEYQARMRQTASSNWGGLTDVMLNSFAWCLARHDADPQRFPIDIGRGDDLMWQFKWMASTLRASPAFSAEQIAEVLDDMQERYSRAGLGMSGVLTARFEDAWAAGRIDEADHLRVQLETTPRDDYSHCDACSRSQVAGFYAATDRDEQAIRLVEEMIEGGFSCGEEPEHALSRVLLPYLRTGQLDQARAAHLRSYRLAKDNPDNLGIVSGNIIFAAVTGNEARALTMVERHLPWLAHDQLNVDGHFAALSAFAFALSRVTAAGHGDAPVRGADAAALQTYFGEHDGPWLTADLAVAAQDAADRIGAQFDARDGSDWHAQRRARLLSLAEQSWDVPIRTDAFAPAPAAPPVDADGWYDRTVALATFGSEHDALKAAARTEGVTDAEKRARLLGIRIGALARLEDWAAAQTLLAERGEVLLEAGHTEQAALEARLGLAMFGRLDEADVAALEKEWSTASTLPDWSRGDLAMVLASARMLADDMSSAIEFATLAGEAFTAAGDARLVASSTFLAAIARLRIAENDEALEMIEALLAQEDLNPGQRARALELRGRIVAGAGRLDEGAADADAAVALLAALGGTQSLAEMQVLAAALWEDAGHPDRAVPRYRTAVRLFAQEGGDVDGVNFRLARAMLMSGHTDEAAELLSDVLQHEQATDVPAGSRALTAAMLARALVGAEEYGQALGAYDHAAQLHESVGEAAEQSMVLAEQAKLLARFGEHAEALELLERAAEIVRPTGQVGAIADVLHTLAQAYGGGGDERAFALFDELQAMATEHEAAWMLADVTDSRGRALTEVDRLDEGIAALLTAADGFAALGDAGSAGGSELFAARALVHAERLEDAVPLYRSVLERAEGIAPLRQVGALELGDVFEKLGRVGEASEVRGLLEG